MDKNEKLILEEKNLEQSKSLPRLARWKFGRFELPADTIPAPERDKGFLKGDRQWIISEFDMVKAELLCDKEEKDLWTPQEPKYHNVVISPWLKLPFKQRHHLQPQHQECFFLAKESCFGGFLSYTKKFLI